MAPNIYAGGDRRGSIQNHDMQEISTNVRIFFIQKGYNQTVWLDEFESSKYYFWKICEQ